MSHLDPNCERSFAHQTQAKIYKHLNEEMKPTKKSHHKYTRTSIIIIQYNTFRKVSEIEWRQKKKKIKIHSREIPSDTRNLFLYNIILGISGRLSSSKSRPTFAILREYKACERARDSFLLFYVSYYLYIQ